MSGYVLTCTNAKAAAMLDGSLFVPGADLTALTEWFDIEGQPGNTLTLRHCPPLDRLGARMKGDTLIIEGDAGRHVGIGMRRGVIRVTGAAGACPGYRMRAGTIVIGRGPYDHPGLEMRRGTIICLDGKSLMDTGAAFACDGVFDSAAVPATMLVMKHLNLPAPSRWRFFSGDRFEAGKGELWQPAA